LFHWPNLDQQDSKNQICSALQAEESFSLHARAICNGSTRMDNEDADIIEELKGHSGLFCTAD
jgi:hypothetical protein